MVGDNMQFVDLFDFNNFDMQSTFNLNEKLTPVEKLNNVYFKREDKYTIFDVCGAKSRQAYHLIANSNKNVIVTCGSRVSPQIQIVANICKHLNKKCICFTNRGSITQELQSAINDGAQIIQNEKWIYNNVVIYHTKQYCNEHPECEYIPFGMESFEAIKQTAYQVQNIPNEVKHIVVCCGSGLNLCGILWGIKLYKRDIKVTAIQVGKDPQKILENYAPLDTDNLTIIKSGIDYHDKVKETTFMGIELDPIYEGKCVPYISDNDLFWIIGKRR